MKFKQLLKDNIKRISAVILCMILLFTCSITALAFDGEAPSKIITAADLKEYHEETYVYYNSTDSTYGQSPIFSPFNTKTTNAVFTISSTSSDGIMYSLDADIYMSVSSGYLQQGNLKTTYIVPDVASGKTWHEKMFAAVNWALLCPWMTNDTVDWYDIFYAILDHTYVSSSSDSVPKFKFYTAYSLWSSLGFSNEFFDNDCRLPAFVYTVDYTKEGLIRNITYGGYYENVADAFGDTAFYGYNGTMSPTQICIHDKTSSGKAAYSSSATPLLNEPSLNSEVINTNQYISSSTYSLTAMDYFGYEEYDGAGSYVTLKSNYYSLSSGASLYVDNYIPSHFLKEEYRSGSEFTQISKDSTKENYYGNRDIYEEGKSWIFIGCFNGANSSRCSGGYYLEFADGINPIVYLKLIKGTSNYSSLYAQLISKVDYNLYYCGYYSNWYKGLLGTFDAETSTYTGTSFTMFQAVDYYNNQSSLANTSVSKFPAINVGSSSSNGYTLPSLSNVVFGTNCVVSCYSTETQGVGFYYYISPENIPNIIENSNSSSGVPGGSGDGSGSTPGTNLDEWEFTIDLDDWKPDFLDMDLPDYPDFTGILNVEFSEIWEIPERIAEYVYLLTDWILNAVTVFFEKYGGSVIKVFTIMNIIFEYQPDVFRFIFIISIFFLFVFKALQYSSASMGALSGTVESINTSVMRESSLKDAKMRRTEYQNNREQWKQETRQYRERRMAESRKYREEKQSFYNARKEFYNSRLEYYKNKSKK